ncbi:V-type ATP synthase subunit F [Clostridia bacterium]|nr:V-type ATP synthase subunit F [Clostridia bacterium]
MKMYLISDNTDTLAGMRLVGVDGCIVHDREHLLRELLSAWKMPDLGILLVSTRLAKEFPDVILDFRVGSSIPLLVEIPDRHGLGRPADFLTRYVKEAIGVRL